jgi:hypothetical protein
LEIASRKVEIASRKVFGITKPLLHIQFPFILMNDIGANGRTQDRNLRLQTQDLMHAVPQ